MWLDVLVGGTYVFAALWLVFLWRLHRSRTGTLRDRDLVLSVATAVLSVVGLTASMASAF